LTIEKIATEKCRFLQKRAKDISISFEKMGKFENALNYSKDIGKEIDKKFPKANKALLKNFKRYKF
jgi:hypothetical protein